MPSDVSTSLPSIETFRRTSGPLPIRFTPLSGAVIFPSSTEVALREREDEVAVRDVDLTAAELLRENPRLTLFRISSGSCGRP